MHIQSNTVLFLGLFADLARATIALSYSLPQFRRPLFWIWKWASPPAWAIRSGGFRFDFRSCPGLVVGLLNALLSFFGMLIASSPGYPFGNQFWRLFGS